MKKILILCKTLCKDSSILSSTQRAYNNQEGIMEIKNCFFLRINTYSYSGSIIWLNSANVQLNIEKSVFENCTNQNSNGGAIFFNCNIETSKASLFEVCAKKCFTGINHMYQFGYFSTYDKSNDQFDFDYLSVGYCSDKEGNGMRALGIWFGDQKLLNSNFTGNFVRWGSSFMTYQAFSFLGKFNSIYKNYCTEYYSIQFDGTYSNQNLEYSNIIDNHCITKGLVFVENGDYHLEKCIFDSNSNILFGHKDGNLYVSNCFINHVFSMGSAIIFSNNEKTNSYELSHFQSRQCHVFINIISSISPEQSQNTVSITEEKTLFSTIYNSQFQTLDLTPHLTISPTFNSNQ